VGASGADGMVPLQLSLRTPWGPRADGCAGRSAGRWRPKGAGGVRVRWARRPPLRSYASRRWRPINDALGMSKSERRVSASWVRRLPRTNFLFDENMQANVVRAIRASGMRIDAAREIGLGGRSDDDIFAVAWNRRQMIGTRDRDFWDDDQFPLRSCAGVLQLPDIGCDLGFFWSIVKGPLRIFARGRDLSFHTKIRVTRERMMIVKTWQHEDGSIATSWYWLRPNGSILIWG
jgi:hypothetical protein